MEHPNPLLNLSVDWSLIAYRYAKTQVGLLAILVITIASVIFGSFFPSIPSEYENAQEGFVGYDKVDSPWDSNYSVDLKSVRVFYYNHISQYKPTRLCDVIQGLVVLRGVRSTPHWLPFCLQGKEYGFFTVFAVAFPAMTGVLAGSNMSGERWSVETCYFIPTCCYLCGKKIITPLCLSPFASRDMYFLYF